jgi:hypothetical protein
MHANTAAQGPFTSWLFAPHFFDAGYRVGVFGKPQSPLKTVVVQ